MSQTSPSRWPDLRRSVVGPARFWCVLILIITVGVIEVLMIIGSIPATPSGGWVWPIAAVATAVCWLSTKARPGAVLGLIVQVIVLWSAVLFPGSPTEESDDVIRGLDQALLGVGAADLLRCLAAGIALLACLLSFGRVTADAVGRQPRRWLGVGVGVVAAALVVAVAVPAGYGLRGISRARVINSAEESQVLEQPDTTGRSTITIGDRPGWSRNGIVAAQPAGDRVIAIEAGPSSGDDAPHQRAIVGLRAADGAVLWRYRVSGTDQQDSVDGAVIDRTSRMIMVRYRATLIGLSFDGAVRYRKPLAESTSPGDQPSMIGDVLGTSATDLQTGGVAVFGGYRGGARAGFAAGYDVATGERLWQYTAASDRCSLARAVGPGKRLYLLAGGKAPCRTELIGYDGSTTEFRVALKAPDGYQEPYSNHAADTLVAEVPPSIAAVGADRVVTAPLWQSEHRLNGHEPFQEVTQLFDTAGTLLGTMPSDLAPGSQTRLLPTPLSSAPDAPLGVVLTGAPPSGSGPRTDRWVTLTPTLQPTGTTKINSGSAYERAGSHLVTWPWGGVDSLHLVTLTPIGSELGRVERLQPTKLPGCGEQINWISSDDARMAVRCGRTILVVPA